MMTDRSAQIAALAQKLSEDSCCMCCGESGSFDFEPALRDLAAQVERETREVAQELYDATTVLNATLVFTHCSEDLLRPELEYACRRVLAARSRIRREGLVIDVAAGLLPAIELPTPFNVPVIRQRPPETPKEPE